MSNVEPLDPLATIERFGIPERPSPKLEPALDATERCLARHGVRRTTMSDIAREMGVSRPTLYKHLTSVEEAIAMVAARQLYVILDELTALLAQGATPQTFIDMAVRLVAFARTHPVAERILVHEPDLIGKFVTSGQMARYSEQVITLVAPVLHAAMEAGAIRVSDPRLTADLISRLCGSLILSPTGGDAEQLINYALGPVLGPAPRRKAPKAAR